jgi:fatty acid desaturase
MSWGFRKQKNLDTATFSWSIPGTGLRGQKIIRIEKKSGILSSIAMLIVSGLYVCLMLAIWFIKLIIWFVAFIIWGMYQIIATSIKAMVNGRKD